MTLRESDDRIVPMKLEDQSSRRKSGNTDEGKAVKISRDPDQASTVLSDGDSVLTRLDRISQRAEAHPEGVSIISFRCSTTSCCGTLFADSNEAKRRESMASRLKTTRRISGTTCETFSTDFTEAPTARCPVFVRTFPKGMGRRDRWASLAWRTNWSNALS